MAAPMLKNINIKLTKLNCFTGILNGVGLQASNIRLLNLSLHRQCHAFEARDIQIVPAKGALHFDTHAAVKHLELSGFNAQQAEGVTKLLTDILSASSDNTYHRMVTKEQQEIAVQQLLANLESVKKDMVILEKSEFQALRNETHHLLSEIKHLREAVDDDLSKLKSSMKLDLNLEKARTQEVQYLTDGKYDRLDNRMDTEVANLNTTFEKYRNDIFKYAGGALISCLTITLGFYRLWS